MKKKHKFIAAIVLLLMLASMAMYVLTLDDSSSQMPQEIIDPAKDGN